MKNKRQFPIFKLLSVLILVAVLGCSTRPCRFSDAPPVTVQRDDRPIRKPESTQYESVYYYFNNLARRPIVNVLDLKRPPRSQDVNSMDEVPASSWFTPRLGARDISPEDLLHGPEQVGPPQPPYTVIKAKHGGGNPGFIIQDGRGLRYLAKFDPPEFPALETTTALIVNRLFWGFGYNVPEDYLVFFSPEDLLVDPQGELSNDDVAQVLALVATPVNGQYRSTFSMFIQGQILGPIAEKGVRRDDPNDLIPHENRRVLRAMRVFGAFTNHSDIRIDNSLDTYLGEDGEGHVGHYMLDFGEAFGGHGAEHDWLWDGFSHFFNYRQVFVNLLTLGFYVRPWENIEYTPWKSVGAFESSVFEPEEWRETYQFLPIRVAQADDDYWAAKIVGALTEEHLQVLVEAAQYPEPEAATYILQTLLERRRKVLSYFLAQTSPLEFVSVEAGVLVLKDLHRTLLPDRVEPSRYQIQYFDDVGHKVLPDTLISQVGSEFEVPVPSDLWPERDDYLRVEVRTLRGEKSAPVATQFHFRPEVSGRLNLVGVVH